jgi:hypothetical protein
MTDITRRFYRDANGNYHESNPFPDRVLVPDGHVEICRLGGGMLHIVPLDDLEEVSRDEIYNTTLTREYATLEWENSAGGWDHVPCYAIRRDRWNGWAKPLFEPEAAAVVAALFSGSNPTRDVAEHPMFVQNGDGWIFDSTCEAGQDDDPSIYQDVMQLDWYETEDGPKQLLDMSCGLIWTLQSDGPENPNDRIIVEADVVEAPPVDHPKQRTITLLDEISPRRELPSETEVCEACGSERIAWRAEVDPNRKAMVWLADDPCDVYCYACEEWARGSIPKSEWEEKQRRISVGEMEERRFGIIERFHAALCIVRTPSIPDGDDREIAATNAAFEYAERFTGWDHSDDEAFMDWCLKATPEEILAEGLRLALSKV